MSNSIKKSVGTQVKYDPEPATSGFQKAGLSLWVAKHQIQTKREQEREDKHVKQRQGCSGIRVRMLCPNTSEQLGRTAEACRLASRALHKM